MMLNMNPFFWILFGLHSKMRISLSKETSLKRLAFCKEAVLGQYEVSQKRDKSKLRIHEPKSICTSPRALKSKHVARANQLLHGIDQTHKHIIHCTYCKKTKNTHPTMKISKKNV